MKGVLERPLPRILTSPRRSSERPSRSSSDLSCTDLIKRTVLASDVPERQRREELNPQTKLLFVIFVVRTHLMRITPQLGWDHRP